jgi:signal transduction histidine kinase
MEPWPVVPVRLSAIIDHETLAVIEAGCSEHLGRPMSILDYDPAADGFTSRIDPSNLPYKWERFCALLRNEQQVMGGNDACQACDVREGRRCLQEFRQTQHPIRLFRCYMGLEELTHIIRVRQRPAALLFCGQYRPAEGVAAIQDNIQRLGNDHQTGIRLTEGARLELMQLAHQLSLMPADLGERVQREVERIERIAEAQFQHVKHRSEQAFLDDLRLVAASTGNVGATGLRQRAARLLEKVTAYCRCDYAVFFGSVQEGDTVLAPIAAAGLGEDLAQALPHFNWKKAGWPVAQCDEMRSPGSDWRPRSGAGGLRGPNSDRFARASCILPTCLGNRYRGALLLGPFAGMVDAASEASFLRSIADTIGTMVLTELEVRYLEQERQRWKSTAMLLMHQLKTALTPITAQIGRAGLMAERANREGVNNRLMEQLKRAEDLSIRLGQSVEQTLDAHVLHLERDDLDFERYPLSVLIANCAEWFAPEFEKKHRQLMVERSIELLPEARVDVARLTIAFSNLIENALKYSFPNTKTFIRSSLQNPGDLTNAKAIVEVDDIGDEVRLEDRERIFEQGSRGLSAAKMGRLPGTGLGLWEAKAVIEAHGGAIDLSCNPTQIQRRQGSAYRVVFSIAIPLHQHGIPGD